ncbi:MAG: multiheme c-type cytochrome [Candidatus Zixiibacteriota bacterium]
MIPISLIKNTLRVLAPLVAAVPFAIFGCDDGATPVGGGGGEIPPPAFSAADFSPAQECQQCHPDQFTDWSGSMHAYAIKDPVFAAINKLGQQEYINAIDQGCVKCHTVIGSRAGETPWGEFSVEKLSPVAQEGVTCDVCHTITSIRGIQNSEIVLTPGDTRFGSIENPQPTDAHESEYHPLYATSEFCASCHDIITGNGLGLETTFREWQNGGFIQTGKTCSGCHMPEYMGPAAVGGPDRPLHRHTFVGTDLALIDFPQKAEQLQLVTQLLQSALTLTVNATGAAVPGAPYTFDVNVTNDKTGHDIPSGATFLREMWLRVVVTDNLGDTVFQSGQLDANDDLLTEESAYPARDTALTSYHATMYRADSIKTFLPWEVDYLVNPGIKPAETKTAQYTFDVPPGAQAPLSVYVSVRYRSFPPFLFRDLGLDSLLPVPIFDMAQQTVSVSFP